MFWLYWVFDKLRGLLLFWRMGSVPLQHVGLSYPIRDWSHIPYIAKQILNYWNTKEVPIFFFFHLLVESQFSFLKYNVKYFRGTYSNQKLSHCYGLNICVGVGRSREAFWRLIILVFLRAVFCCIYVRTHPCREAGETSLSQSRTALHGATLCSIYSSLLWSFSKCIISFTGFSARIQKYLKVSVTLAFHLLPFPKQKKQIRQTHCLFVSISNSGTTIYRNAIHLCFHGCFQVGSDAVPLASSYLIQSLPGSSIFPYVLARSSLQLGGVPGTPQPK